MGRRDSTHAEATEDDLTEVQLVKPAKDSKKEEKKEPEKKTKEQIEAENKMKSRRKLLASFVAFFGFFVVGNIFYMNVEGYDFTDANFFIMFTMMVTP